MAELIEYLVHFGGFGMFLSAFLAGTVIPFSSELVLAALQLAGVSNLSLLLWGTAGNTIGSSINYGIGMLGKMEWIEKYSHVKKDKLEKSKRFVEKYGPLMGLFAWIPIFGSALTIALGLLRSNFWLTVMFMIIGKAARYAVIIYFISSVH